jgi:hypothetical protein
MHNVRKPHQANSCHVDLSPLAAPLCVRFLQYFDVLRLACESQNAAATTVALDVIQKLIAYGYLRGDVARKPTVKTTEGAAAAAEGGGALVVASEAAEVEATVPLIDVVVETICGCNDFADDGVQLQVIKALLTAITTDHCKGRTSTCTGWSGCRCAGGWAERAFPSAFHWHRPFCATPSPLVWTVSRGGVWSQAT